MRIGFDAKRSFYNHRGLGNYSRTLIKSLLEFYPDFSYFLFTPPIKNSKFKNFFQARNSKIIEPHNLIDCYFHSFWRNFRLSQEINNHELDIYHGLSHELPQGIQYLKIKKIVTIHDLLVLRYPQFFSYIDRKIYLKKIKYACEVADLIIAICEQTKKDLIQCLNIDPHKIKVLYQSCHPRFYVKIDDDKKEIIKKKYDLSGSYLLNVGAIEERKNNELLIHIFEKIKSDFPNLKLIFIGKGRSYKKYLEKIISNYNLESRVLFLEVEDKELPAIYQMSELFLFPSFFEGFGIPIIEAMYSNIPVLISRVSCFTETAGSDAYFLNPHVPDDWVQAIKKILLNSELRNEIINKAQNHVKKFHWSQTSKNLVSIYSELLSFGNK